MFEFVDRGGECSARRCVAGGQLREGEGTRGVRDFGKEPQADAVRDASLDRFLLVVIEVGGEFGWNCPTSMQPSSVRRTAFM